VEDPACWALLAALAIDAVQLGAAEAAFGALDAVDKLAWVRRVAALPSEEGRAAELSVFRRRPDEAEGILLNAGLLYRAIKLNVRLFRWERALALAQQHQRHVDTVLMHRRVHLEAAGARESLPAYLAAAEGVVVDVDAIKARVDQEKAAEAARGGARR
jgi:intraflagellar transport protein 80